MQEYTQTIDGIDHTVQLDDDDAKRLGVKPVQGKAAQPQNKSRTSGSGDK